MQHFYYPVNIIGIPCATWYAEIRIEKRMHKILIIFSSNNEVIHKVLIKLDTR